MADGNTHTEDWQTLPWSEYQRNVFRLQQRIYQAARRDDWKAVHNLQRLLLRSWSARCLAVRQVTQENRGKRTPGVDGIAALTPTHRLALAQALDTLAHWQATPIRRVYIPKPGSTEQRGLGIPTIRDRAMQALVKLALEPEWEASFEPNSYGFRPGRSCHDAIEAIFNFIRLKPKYVLDADLEKCFDRINHSALLAKLKAPYPITRLIHAWLKAGILDQGQLIFPQAGTPQGGPLSPLLANIALHGLEQILIQASPSSQPAAVIRYADDLVILHPDRATLTQLKEVAEQWLASIGLRFSPSKTRLTHTLNPHEGQVGFDFLGFTIRQYQVGKYRTRSYRGKAGFKTIIKPSAKAVERHWNQIQTTIHQYRGGPQAALIAALNPRIRGWTAYYRTCSAKRTFSKLDYLLNYQLSRWARYRHKRKTSGWRRQRYWQRQESRTTFTDGESNLINYEATAIVRHVKVRGEKSPYDGDWVYWGERLGRDPTKPKRITRLLKHQHGRCSLCGLRFTAMDMLEIHHQDHNQHNNQFDNLALLHSHCHDQIHGKRYQ